MSKYTVTSIPLAAVPGLHGGTGFHQNPNWLVVPSSVDGSGKLQFVGQWVGVTTMLFELNTADCPNWFGVAIPVGIQDFSRANIFFHPLPQQGGYSDSDYTTKGGTPPHTPWPNLFYYMERLGYQMDGAARSQITIMPFLKQSASDTGIFLANWADIVTDILRAVRIAMGADDGSVLQLAEVVVSSYSVGIVYSANFRAGAPNLGTYLSEVWDLDGLFSTSNKLSTDLVSTPAYLAIKYDQNPTAGSGSFHVPLDRWSDYVAPPVNSSAVHALVGDFMFLHAASISRVGATITTSNPAPPQGTNPDAPMSPVPDSNPSIPPTPTSPVPDSPAPIPSTPISPAPQNPLPNWPMPISPAPQNPLPNWPMPISPAPQNPLPNWPTPIIPDNPLPLPPFSPSVPNPAPISVYPAPGPLPPTAPPIPVWPSRQPSVTQPSDRDGCIRPHEPGEGHFASDCGCGALGVVGTVATVATVAAQAVTAIVAIVAVKRSPR
jgi:hypothetical protein